MKSTSSSDQTLTQIDRRLLELLAERVEACRSQSEATSVIPQISLESVADFDALKSLDSESLAAWLRHAGSLCQQAASTRTPIAYLGPIYSYTYLAGAEFFGLAAELVPVSTIAAAFDELVRGHAKFAVVPIENSTDGRVVDTLGMFAKTPVQICGEVLLPIHHCLLGRCGRKDIQEIQSKPQALSQCRNWLAAHLPGVKLVEVASTAAAAIAAAKQPGVAAIASREAGVHNSLDIIDENIEDNSGNVTRFAIIGDMMPAPTDCDKTSLMVQVPHQPGALASAMQVFQSAELNLTWIESFPLPESPSEYLFFIELDGHRSTPSIAAAIEELRQQAMRLEVLGSYPKGKI